MKRIFMMMAAAVLMGTTAMAQGNNGQRPQIDRTEMIKQRTDQMVEKYKLNDPLWKQFLDYIKSSGNSTPYRSRYVHIL